MPRFQVEVELNLSSTAWRRAADLACHGSWPRGWQLTHSDIQWGDTARHSEARVSVLPDSESDPGARASRSHYFQVDDSVTPSSRLRVR